MVLAASGASRGSSLPGPPTNVSATVQGLEVTLSWSPPADVAVDSYQVEAGSAPGASDLLIVNVGKVTHVGPVTSPVGTFFLRVRAVADGHAGPPSPDVVVTVTSGCSSSPGAPRDLAVTVKGTTVGFTWLPPASGGAVASYVLEAGTSSGMSDLGVVDVGNRTSTPPVELARDTYFVRVRARNGCGVGPVSNEVAFTVPSGVGAPKAWGIAIEPVSFDESCGAAPVRLKVVMNGEAIVLSRKAGDSKYWSGYVGRVPIGQPVDVDVTGDTGCGKVHFAWSMTWPPGTPAAFVGLCSLFPDQGGVPFPGPGIADGVTTPSSQALYDACLAFFDESSGP